MTAMITNTARARIVAELVAACSAAKREFPKVGTANHPTPWDVKHGRIDGLLDDLETTPA